MSALAVSFTLMLIVCGLELSKHVICVTTKSAACKYGVVDQRWIPSKSAVSLLRQSLPSRVSITSWGN